MNKIADSELILNPDGSVYHLNLKPENIAHTIIFVGDQNRVPKITKHFDSIEFETQKREFRTITGVYKGIRMSVISTGIGPDNIDIVLNELDALVNIDLETRTVKKQHTQLNIVRIGTSGSLQKDIPVDSFVLAKYGLGFDGMLLSYDCDHVLEADFENAFIKHTNWSDRKARPYIVKNSTALEKRLLSNKVFAGVTATAGGFYGPQGRVLRLAIQDPELNSKIDNFEYKGVKITNLEMETSAIYGLSKLLGHNACSMNAIIANRANGTFSEDPYKPVEELIIYTLDKLSS
ncbi:MULTISPECIES: nucleoside phosphorylase [Flavobacteriaceae]|uniref:Uridine phosphorylase n=2 Tax=Flavobacteriaceae TaxID=49546 RepID=A0A4Y8AW15_9FLAO|nr:MULTISPECIES: nucleoside phosphorylase [Flavobacteriaceae]TEW76325.1 phosphorylase [Gramella jeungdoensis]GGK51942.1 phosphorylase [Lutibacter litoralis]